jgi:Tfp pilus assembly protein PilF
MRTGKFDEAEAAINKAMSLSQTSLGFFLHMAELQARKGNVTRARDIVDMLNEKVDELSAAEQEDLNAVSRLLDERAAKEKAR